jgi:hypothetical protein
MKSPIVVAVAALCVAGCSKQEAPSEQVMPAPAEPAAPAQDVGMDSAADTIQSRDSSVGDYAAPAADAAAPPPEPPINPDETGGPQIDPNDPGGVPGPRPPPRQ